MTAVKALLFDLDNTLINRNKAVKYYMRQWLRRHFPRLQPAVVEEELKRIMQKDNWGYTCRMEFFSWMKEHYSGNFTPAALLEDFLAQLPFYLKPCLESSELIQGISKRYSVGLFTNGGARTQRKKLQMGGLTEAFAPDRIFVSAELGYEKPQRQAYAAVLEALQLSAEEVLMIGDDPLNDIEGAGSAGLQTCWLSHQRSYPTEYRKPNYTIGNLRELLKLLPHV